MNKMSKKDQCVNRSLSKNIYSRLNRKHPKTDRANFQHKGLSGKANMNKMSKKDECVNRNLSKKIYRMQFCKIKGSDGADFWGRDNCFLLSR